MSHFPLTMQRVAHRERAIGTHASISAFLTMIVVVAVVAIGLSARFYNLGEKLYWIDEVATSIHIGGQRIRDVRLSADPQTSLTAGDFVNRYQTLQPDRGVKDTVMALARSDPEHPPLYYTLLYGWAKLFGTSPAALRSMSALVGVLSVGLMFWMSLELFGERRAAVAATLLFAISPIQVLYAQEAREYALWVALFLLSSALLLRNLRRPSRTGWILYASSLAAGCYTDTLMLAVIAAHGLYVLGLAFTRRQNQVPQSKPAASRESCFEYMPRPRALKGYAMTAVAAVLAFSPWIAILAMQFLWRTRTSLNWLDSAVPLPKLLLYWVRNSATAFVDFNNASQFFGLSHHLAVLPSYLLSGACVLLVVHAIHVACRRSHPRTWLFLLVMAGLFTLPLFAADLVKGGHRTLVPRYVLPLFAISVASVGWLLACRLKSPRRTVRWTWSVICCALVFLGLSSLWYSAHARWWWNKGRVSPVQMADIIEADRPALVVSSLQDAGACQLLSVCRRIDPATRIYPVVGNNDIPSLPAVTGDIYFIDPSKVQQRKLHQQSYSVTPIGAGGHLWRVDRPSAS